VPGQTALTLVGTADRILLSDRPDCVLGRGGDQARGPDVDLSPYGARDKGVSRRHARLQTWPGGAVVTDLGSTNGTLVNGRRLAPNEPTRLADGDELRLGRLAFTVTIAA
jgi:pSer/pThr/pTyr-binding forkhead associated (FHA) protein